MHGTPGSGKSTLLHSIINSDKSLLKSSINLPPFWECRIHANGRQYFVDHAHKITTWSDPRSTDDEPHSLKHSDILILRHFFNDKGVGGEGASPDKSFEGFLRSILRQLYLTVQRLKNPEGFGVPLISSSDLSDGLVELSSQNTAGTGIIKKAILAVLLELGRQSLSLYLFIDAVDECAQGLDECLGFIKDAVSQARDANNSLHICVSRRDYPIMPFFDTLQDMIEIKIDNHTSDDIGKVWPNEIAVPKSHIEGVKKNFIVAKCYESYRNIQEHADSESLGPPKALDDFYLQVLQKALVKIELHDLAMILECVLAAQEPLDLSELSFACNIRSGHKRMQLSCEKDLVANSGGLLAINPHPPEPTRGGASETVGFVHFTIRKFLSQPGGPSDKLFSSLQAEYSLAAQGQDRLISACMSSLEKAFTEYQASDTWYKDLPKYEDKMLLSDPTFSVKTSEKTDLSSVFSTHCFLRYALLHLWSHLDSKMKLDNATELDSIAKTLFASTPVPSLEPESNARTVVGPLPVPSLRLVDMCGHLINCYTGEEIFSPSISSLQFLIAVNMMETIDNPGSIWFALNLIEGKNKYKQSIWHWAAFMGSLEVVERLFETHVILCMDGANGVNTFDADLFEQRFADFPHWQDSTIWGLLGGRDGERDDGGRTPLHLAAARGHIEVADFLIVVYQALWVVMNDPGYCLPSELLEASGPFEIKVKVNNAFSPQQFLNMQDSSGNTALHLAVISGHIEMAELLLKWGADGRCKGTMENKKTPEETAIDLAKNSVGEKRDIFKSLVRLLRKAAFEAVKLAVNEPCGPRTADPMFEAVKVEFTNPSSTGVRIHRTQIKVSDLICSSDAVHLPGSRSSFTWIHLPANVVSVFRSISRHPGKLTVSYRCSGSRYEW